MVVKVGWRRPLEDLRVECLHARNEYLSRFTAGILGLVRTPKVRDLLLEALDRALDGGTRVDVIHVLRQKLHPLIMNAFQAWRLLAFLECLHRQLLFLFAYYTSRLFQNFEPLGPHGGLPYSVNGDKHAQAEVNKIEQIVNAIELFDQVRVNVLVPCHGVRWVSF